MRIIIIGCGRMGAGLVQTLVGRGHTVTVVDRDGTAFERLGTAFNGRRIIGIGFDRDILREAGITRADALAAVTASDEANVVTARVARQVFRVPRVVARVFDPRKAEIYARLGILTISPTTWGTQRIAELLDYSELHVMASLGGGEADLVELHVPHPLVGRTIHELTAPGDMAVVAISRSGKTLLPTPHTQFQAGDLAYLVVLPAANDRLRALLGTLGGGAR